MSFLFHSLGVYGVAAVVFVMSWTPSAVGQTDGSAPFDPSAYADAAERIIRAALDDSVAFDRLAELADTFGPRFTGTPNLERAIDWVVEQMRRDGLERVRTEEVRVPHWDRGEESLVMLKPRRAEIPMLGLGRSIGTPPGGISGEVLVVSSFDELERRAEEAEGKIVLFNAPFTTYGQTVRYRSSGAVAAARAGAVASLIRSVGPFSMQTPHTGTTNYSEGVPRIPHAAISLEAAEMFARMTARGQRVTVRLEMGARTLPDTTSRNVIAEFVGRERPEEIVVVGGHIDSWDVGQGAHDDAGGSVASWEAVRLLAELGLRPRRTIRVVLWTNEENGLRGATTYKDNQGEAVNDHVLAIESDAGVFAPTGFGFAGSDEAFAVVQRIGRLLEPIGADTIARGGGGADIGPLMREGVPGMGLNVDRTRYFWYHHTDADTIDKVDPDAFNRCVAALAVMVYVVAEMPERLPR